jgi:hypothetical protein
MLPRCQHASHVAQAVTVGSLLSGLWGAKPDGRHNSMTGTVDTTYNSCAEQKMDMIADFMLSAQARWMYIEPLLPRIMQLFEVLAPSRKGYA